ncbi:glucosamine-6-phosphate deaminase [candidate division WOR-3 bacterium JGI_Cruoil_03_44_89]|uniref:Glucosamine-6-phosphate deaminase n=1 Tax=candidate division WOR-3 bacterium JGI_Cruoil_03_44_89 TaxID=1973748 RepID=A0A235BYH4_UNCW3|nr:MAG: glucosamine-6-phosphate deaminase [candidate division WOR-3 bacterium JGI_Cruoil_03_44_89]
MLVLKVKDHEELSERAAGVIADEIRKKQDIVLGLATGETPLGVYRSLIRMHEEEGLDFSKVTTFNLDEYVGLSPTHKESYHYFMHENLFKHINMDPRNVYIPDGMVKDISAYCEWYEKKITELGGIDIQILGIGRDGHIGFNEPGSSLGSRTRIKTLSKETIEDNARFFWGVDNVPRTAITMGIQTIIEAKLIILLASGKRKAEIVRLAIEGPVSSRVPASIIQFHRKAAVIIDQEAASLLTREYSIWGEGEEIYLHL